VIDVKTKKHSPKLLSRHYQSAREGSDGVRIELDRCKDKKEEKGNGEE
jgi:hypothetical protein